VPLAEPQEAFHFDFYEFERNMQPASNQLHITFNKVRGIEKVQACIPRVVGRHCKVWVGVVQRAGLLGLSQHGPGMYAKSFCPLAQVQPPSLSCAMPPTYTPMPGLFHTEYCLARASVGLISCLPAAACLLTGRRRGYSMR
jgi:hypothetical protein